MFSSPMRSALILCAASVGLGGCASYYGHGGYGLGGLSVGYGDPYYRGAYGSPYGSYYGNRYYDPYRGNRYGSYYGWHNGFYYPGTGYYIYDRYRRPHRWSNAHRRYWEGRRAYRYKLRRAHPNWSDFTYGPRDRVRIHRRGRP